MVNPLPKFILRKRKQKRNRDVSSSLEGGGTLLFSHKNYHLGARGMP